ncbi:hypothetical protein MZD93_18810, partial [Escherichia coli]|nr:hypothetical protein [Escherichia coli]MCK2356317.1 hypothetical protein [Escherichia coli]
MNILQKFILLMFRSLFMMVISYNALANDTVVVTFTGQLLAKTCDITTGSKDQPVNMGTGFAPIFPDTCYHLTHYWPAAADIPV